MRHWLPAILLCAFAAAQPPNLRRYLDHPNFHWRCASLPHIDFCFPDDMAADPEIAAAKIDVEKTLLETVHLAGASSYAPRVHVFLVESYQRMQDLISSYAAGGSLPNEHVVFYAIGHPEALAHEMHHEVFTKLWGPSEPWIAEGLAAYTAEPDKVDSQFRKLIADRKTLPLGLLVTPRWQASMYSADVTYPELGSFVKFLKSQYGDEALRKIWHEGSKGLTRVYGKPLPTLEKEWHSHVTRFASPSISVR